MHEILQQMIDARANQPLQWDGGGSTQRPAAYNLAPPGNPQPAALHSDAGMAEWGHGPATRPARETAPMHPLLAALMQAHY